VTSYEVRPGEGVGPLAHGMTRENVQELLGAPDRQQHEDFDEDESVEIWEYDELGIFAWFDEEDDYRLSTITIFHEDATIAGVRFVGLREEELAAAVREAGLGEAVLDEEFEPAMRDYQCDDPCISFWVDNGVVENFTAQPRFDDDDETVLWPEPPEA